MSLILDALKKSESERTEQASPRSRSTEHGRPRRPDISQRKMILIVALIVVTVMSGLLLYPDRAPSPTVVAHNDQPPASEPVRPDRRPQLPPTSELPAPPGQPERMVKSAPLPSMPPTGTQSQSPVAEPVLPLHPLPVEQPALSDNQPVDPAPQPVFVAPQPSTVTEKSLPPAEDTVATPTPVARKEASVQSLARETADAPLSVVAIVPKIKVPTTADTLPGESEIKIPTVYIEPPFVPTVKPTAPPKPVSSDDLTRAKGHLLAASEFERAGNIDQAIEEYGKAIALDGGNAEAFLARGWAHESNRAYEAAINDFSTAIVRRSDFSDAYIARAWALEQRGNITDAISDYSKVIELQPDRMDARMSRGILRYYNDQKILAAQDFRNVQKNADAELSDYGLLWLYVDRLRVVANPASVRGDFSGIQARTQWPGILYRSFVGESDIKAVIAAMQEPTSLATRKRQCVGYFYLGQYQLAVGDKSKARAYFQKTLESGITSYRQYRAAKIELERLGTSQ